MNEYGPNFDDLFFRRMETQKTDSKTGKKGTRPNWKTSSKTKIEMDFHSDARVTEVKCKLTQKW